LYRQYRQYRLLALDIDGTLLDDEDRVHDDVHAAVRAVQQRDIEVVLATGRRFRTMSEVADQLELAGPAICYNGAVTKELGTGVTHRAQWLPEAVTQCCIDLLREWGPPMVYADGFDGWAGIDIIAEAESGSRMHPKQRNYLDANRAFTREVASLESVDLSRTLMVAVVGDPRSLAAMAERAESELGAAAVVRFLSHPTLDAAFLEVLPIETDKWNALLQLAVDKGLGPEQIVAIGDDTNDTAMVTHSGLGIAMGNAHESVKRVADVVTESNSEAGVARAIERYLLG